MRLILFFDLPRYNSLQNKQANYFVKELTKSGFFMLQESVYCKLLLNANWKKGIIQMIKAIKPKEGSIMILTVTEKQYNAMDFLLGTKSTNVFESSDRMVIL